MLKFARRRARSSEREPVKVGLVAARGGRASSEERLQEALQVQLAIEPNKGQELRLEAKTARVKMVEPDAPTSSSAATATPRSSGLFTVRKTRPPIFAPLPLVVQVNSDQGGFHKDKFPKLLASSFDVSIHSCWLPRVCQFMIVNNNIVELRLLNILLALF